MKTIHETSHIKSIGNIRIEYLSRFYEDVRVEEGHGFHTFYDIDEIDKKILAIYLEFDNCEIDITSRLKKDELEEILNNLE
jgi:hypothetical protein